MKIIIHIGMGKTGTTSLQRALTASGDALASQNARYLGRWFPYLGEEIGGRGGIRAISRGGVEKQQERADLFVERLKTVAAEESIDTFIVSNEGIMMSKIRPFIRRIGEQIDAQVIAYVRDPRTWLPSAYKQWAIRHKSRTGDVLSFEEFAPTLIKRYERLRAWREDFGDRLDVRLHDKAINVIEDFSIATGIDLDEREIRRLEGNEPAELLLRARFNSRHQETVSPRRFNREVLCGDLKRPGSLNFFIEQYFDYSDTESVIEDHADTFSFLSDEYGIDFLNSEKQPPTVSRADLQDRLIDYLVEIQIRQAERISTLERRLAERDDDE